MLVHIFHGFPYCNHHWADVCLQYNSWLTQEKNKTISINNINFFYTCRSPEKANKSTDVR